MTATPQPARDSTVVWVLSVRGKGLYVLDSARTAGDSVIGIARGAEGARRVSFHNADIQSLEVQVTRPGRSDASTRGGRIGRAAVAIAGVLIIGLIIVRYVIARSIGT